MSKCTSFTITGVANTREPLVKALCNMLLSLGPAYDVLITVIILSSRSQVV